MNRERLLDELDHNWEVLAEPIQTGDASLWHRKTVRETERAEPAVSAWTAEGMKQFIDGLELPEDEKTRLKAMTPANYIGRAIAMVDELK
ncbi:Adenylosuccinate lyase [Leclercia adecarboxylata]|uniref:Adenylosuccinate lyase n=1 Tax=Leclercia adecarboxylata TaxID=83655 RepID=A0A4U9HQP4_9ENTR|nr:Adenylosuccinate lyase [Leclercia adecarboxylata]